MNKSVRSLAGKTVLFVFPAFVLGGAERQGLLLARYLKEECNANVSVLGLLESPNTVGDACKSLGIPSRIVPFRVWTQRWHLLAQLTKFALLFRRERVDLVLPYTHIPNLLCNTIWRWTGAKACIWQQRDAGIERGPHRLEIAGVRKTSGFISNSTPGADFLINQLGAKANRIRYIPNGVSLAPPVEGREQWRARLGLAPDCFASVMVANLQQFKDHETLLRAWKEVLVSWSSPTPPVLLLAGGFGDTHHRLKALAYDLELGRAVRFLGQVKDISGLLAASDLCVFSSKLEGSPNGVLEAMASGLPVVATDIPGIREAVGEEGIPWLASVGDRNALSGKIVLIARQPELRASLGESNRRRTQTCFSPARMQSQTMAAILEWMPF